MRQSPASQGRHVLAETMPAAACIFLADLLHKPPTEIADAQQLPACLLDALSLLPETGWIQGEKNQRIIRSVFLLLSYVPTSDPRKEELERLIRKAAERIEV
jgi:hypothetical protein